MQEKKINFQVTLEFISFTLKVKLGSSTCTLKVKGSSLTLLSIRTRDSAWTLGSWYPAPKYEKRSVEIKGISQVHILLYGDKFNGEIDIVQFIFTRCVVYSFSEYFFLLFHSTTKNINDCLYEKDYLVCNLPNKINCTSYNYMSYKSTWTSPKLL